MICLFFFSTLKTCGTPKSIRFWVFVFLVVVARGHDSHFPIWCCYSIVSVSKRFSPFFEMLCWNETEHHLKKFPIKSSPLISQPTANLLNEMIENRFFHQFVQLQSFTTEKLDAINRFNQKNGKKNKKINLLHRWMMMVHLFRLSLHVRRVLPFRCNAIRSAFRAFHVQFLRCVCVSDKTINQ